MEKQIFNPPIPYIGPIYRRNFSPGKIIRIQGFPPGYAYRFDINLQCGYETAPPSDVALQISVRLLDDYISLNSLQNGIWDEEQCGLLVIKRREKFEITLICDFNQYKVAINDQHYCEFPQRIHYDHITHLTIDGDVSIIEIYYDSASTVGSGAASASALNASALLADPLLENGGDGFQIINTATRARNLEIQHPSPSSEFSELPSYEAALAASNRPPYPTSNPIGMPNPTCVSEIMGISYPPNHAAPISPQLYSAPSIPPPPPAVSNVRPPIPYVGSIYERNFSPGKLIRIKGLVPGTAYRFDINLQCGWKTVPSSDVAMQISVRLLDDYISLNSLQNGVWGEEQCGVLTVKHRENFEILLLCDFNQYKVAINGRHYCEFPMRIHYDRVTHLAIDGDVSISQISYESTSKVETQVASASAFTSITVPLLQNGGDHFEIINTATVGQNLETKHFSSSSEFAEPPSYEASFHTSSRPSYPTNKPTGAPGTLGASAYPRQMDNGQVFNGPVIPPPPPGLFNVRPATPYSTKKKILIGCGVVLSVLLVVAVKFLIAYIEA